MSLRIITVGKKHEAWVADGIERYQKRLRKPFDVEWVFMAHSAQHGARARQDESERILQRLDDSYVILLDETGTQLDSPGLAQQLRQPLESSRSVTLIIGGAYGVDERLQARADFVWSLSKLVFPHQVVRLLLIEQLYRAQEIAGNRPYHHS